MPNTTGILKRCGMMFALWVGMVYGFEAAAQEPETASPVQSASSQSQIEALQHAISEVQAQIAELKTQMTAMTVSMAAAKSAGSQPPPSRGAPVSGRCSLAVSAVSSFVPA